MKNAQEKNEENLHFIQRVDEYQFRCGLKRAAACAEIGISEGRLSEIRNGKVSVSGKFWRKLEAAERLAGISPHEARADAAKAADPPKEQSPPPQIPFADLQELNRQLFAMREAQAEALREIAALLRDQQRAIEAHMRETAALRAKLAALEDGRPTGEPLA